MNDNRNLNRREMKRIEEEQMVTRSKERIKKGRSYFRNVNQEQNELKEEIQEERRGAGWKGK